MRLTLRTLLAYLDDTLDAAQAKQIGLKVAESDVAQELIDKIKKMPRKRSLTIPSTTGPDAADANTVAEYLDNDLPAEKLEEIEKQALQSDVHLAEIAACHQLLTLILSEPAKVPPTARQRMYGLVSGPETDPSRKAPRVASATLNPEQHLTDDFDTSPLVSRKGGRTRLLVAGGLAVLLAFVVVQTMMRRNGEPPVYLPPGTDVAVMPSDKISPPTSEKTKPEAQAPEVKAADKPKDEKAAEKSPPPPVTPAEVEKAGPPPVNMSVERKTSEDRKEIGKFVTAGGLLFQSVQPGAKWDRVGANAPVFGAARVMSLPGLQGEVRIGDAVRLDLFGTPADCLVPAPVFLMFESLAHLFVPPAGFDADLRLERGRIYLRAGKPQGAKVQLRIRDDLFDVTFTDDQSEVLAETSTMFNGEPVTRDIAKAEPPNAVASVAVTRGKVAVRTNMQATANLKAAPGPAVLSWDSKSGPAAAPQVLNESKPLWAKQPQFLPRDRQLELEAFAKRALKELSDPNKNLSLAVEELTVDRSPWGRAMTIYSQAALEDLPKLVDALEDDQVQESRIAAIYALQQWLGRDPANDGKLIAALMSKKGYSDAQADAALTLMHGYSDAELKNRDTFVRAVDNLLHERLAVRELALMSLNQIDLEGYNKIRFNPTDAPDRRQRVQKEWKQRIPDAKVGTNKG